MYEFTVKLVILFTFIATARAQVFDEEPPAPPKFEDTITRTETIHHPLLSKVFPGLEFREETSNRRFPLEKRIVGIFEGKTWDMPYSFNQAFHAVSSQSSATLYERLEAFVRIKFWTDDPTIRILSYEEVSIKKIIYTFNHRFIIRRMYDGRPDVTGKMEILIAFDQDQIIEVQTCHEHDGRYEGPSIFNPILINSLDVPGYGQREVQVAISVNSITRHNICQQLMHS